MTPQHPTMTPQQPQWHIFIVAKCTVSVSTGRLRRIWALGPTQSSTSHPLLLLVAFWCEEARRHWGQMLEVSLEVERRWLGEKSTKSWQWGNLIVFYTVQGCQQSRGWEVRAAHWLHYWQHICMLARSRDYSILGQGRLFSRCPVGV